VAGAHQAAIELLLRDSSTDLQSAGTYAQYA